MMEVHMQTIYDTPCASDSVVVVDEGSVGSMDEPDDEFLTFESIFGSDDDSLLDQVARGTSCDATKSVIPFVCLSVFELLKSSQSKGSIEERPNKRMKRQVDNDLLHRACCDPNVTVDDIAQLLLQDPTALGREVSLSTIRTVYNPICNKYETRSIPEAYKYPLNLAIEHGASFDVLEMLVTADPSILLKKDGLQGENSLLILLKRPHTCCKTVDMLLLQDPRCAKAPDRHMNTPLHVACCWGASLEIVRHLCIIHRASLASRNFHGRTPLQVAQANTYSCSQSNEIVQYLSVVGHRWNT